MKSRSTFSKILVSMVVTFAAMASVQLLMDFRKELKRAKAFMGFIPSDFDLRDLGWSTPTKQQAWGTCWIFSTYSSLESNLLINGEWNKAGEEGPVDLAEYHMDKFNSFTRKGDDSHLKQSWYSGQGSRFSGGNHDDLESGVIVHLGGDYRMATSILTTNKGAIQERLTPAIKGHLDHDVFGDKPEEGVLLENNYTYFKPDHVEFLTLQGSDEVKRDLIKRAIIRHGAVASAQHMDDDPIGRDKKGLEIHMYKGKKKVNHAISLIGWDDEFVFKKHKGAWLVKDSDHKDEKSGEHIGYFWVLYDDIHVGKDPYMGGVSFRGVKKRTSERTYSHSSHGWRYSTGKDSKIKKVGNLFVSEKDEEIQSIGIYTTSKNTHVDIEILSDVNGVLLEETGESFPLPGFHRIVLKKPLKIKEGDKFFVTQKNNTFGYAFDSSFMMDVLLGKLPPWGEPVFVQSRALPGESFYFDGSGWKDFVEYQKDSNIALNVYLL